ncbi:MAG TPA: alpha/beta family hydrolase [Actinomycetota bacterium]|nr:alpha/beta family hydrolase [Actinomycetota bacterium]
MEVQIPAGRVELNGELRIPDGAMGVVAFAHGTGSGRFSPRNQQVAAELRKRGLGTLLMDLLTEEEERVDLGTAQLRFDIGLLTDRMTSVVEWLSLRGEAASTRIGLFGASTGAAAALVAASRRPDQVLAVVSRGGRPDLAHEVLPAVRAPTLLIVGERDEQVLELNRSAMGRMTAQDKLEIVPGATHLFEELGALHEVARLAGEWFSKYLPSF